MTSWFLALALATTGPAPADLHGGWVLVALHHGDSVSHDPRFSANLELDANGTFDLSADSVQEIRLVGPRGETTRMRHNRLHLAGRYVVDGRRLILAPAPPPAGEDLAFARRHFGEPDARGRFAPNVSVSGHLFLGNPAVEHGLEFDRRKRR